MGLPFLFAHAAEGARGGGGEGASAQLRLLESLSGVLALGVGDAAAAVAGTLAAHARGKAACLPWADVAAAWAGRPERGASGVTVLGTAAFALSVAAVGWGVVAACAQPGGAAAGGAAWGGLEAQAWGALLASAAVGAGVEAGTGAVDNAVVPIYAWAAVRGVRAWAGR